MKLKYKRITDVKWEVPENISRQNEEFLINRVLPIIDENVLSGTFSGSATTSILHRGKDTLIKGVWSSTSSILHIRD